LIRPNKSCNLKDLKASYKKSEVTGKTDYFTTEKTIYQREIPFFYADYRKQPNS
jgi:hypothetical protein